MTLFSLFGLCSAEAKEKTDVYKGLREQVLKLKLKDLGIDSKKYPNQVYATLMETGYKKATVTVASIIDGTTSLYFSNGGGVLGSGQDKSVKDATMGLLHFSEKHLKQMKETVSFPSPKIGEVKFYIITKKGVFTYSALENDLGYKKDKLHELFFAGQYVISEVRKVDEKRRKKKKD